MSLALVKDYEGQNYNYEKTEIFFGKVVAVKEKIVIVCLKLDNGKEESKALNRKIPFNYYLEVGEYVKLTIEYGYDTLMEIYDSSTEEEYLINTELTNVESFVVQQHLIDAVSERYESK